jgi:hypothetical protein
MRTEQERLASYRAAFLEKVKKWRSEEHTSELQSLDVNLSRMPSSA